MPGSARSCPSSRGETGSPHVLIVSAAVRYARILKAFSPLISSRSAISANTRAIWRLSTNQSVAFDGEVEKAGPSFHKCISHRVASIGRAEADETAPAAGAADLGACRARACGAGDEVVDHRSRHSRSETLPILPLLDDRAANPIPVAAAKGGPHGDGDVADALEAVEHMTVAVDVLLHDFP